MDKNDDARAARPVGAGHAAAIGKQRGQRGRDSNTRGESENEEAIPNGQEQDGLFTARNGGSMEKEQAESSRLRLQEQHVPHDVMMGQGREDGK